MSASSEQVVSPVDTEKPEFVISAQSINAEPVELDSTPTSPEKVRARRASRDELLAELGEKEKKVSMRWTNCLLALTLETLADELYRSVTSCS